MWKVLLLLACVASLTIVCCDDSSDDDNGEIESSYRTVKSSAKQFQSSSSSSSSSISSSSISSSPKSSSSKSLKSSSSSSLSSSSSSESSLTKTEYLSNKRSNDDDDTSSSESDDSGDSAGEDTTNGSQNDDSNNDFNSDTGSESDDSGDSAGEDTTNGSQNDDSNNDFSSDTAPSIKCGCHEVLSDCINGGCTALNCSQVGIPVPCVKLDPKSCIKGCVCETGYLRTANGTCVSTNECSEGCGNDPNAHPGCGVNCGKTCSTYNIKNIACPLICYLNGCDCNDGYVHDPAVNKCVLPEDCTPVCGVNEEPSNCSNGGCGPWTCSDLGKPVKCVRPAKCLKGCVCKRDYVRHENGTCVAKDQCSGGCGGDPNAKPGCGVNCGKTCTTYKVKNPICPLICELDGCDCLDGYVFDTNVKKCVLPEECTPICGLNEVFSSCSNGGCGHRNCSQLGQPILCVDPAPGYCTKGCICASGYLYASNGTCVLQDQCSAVEGCGGDPNAKPGCGVNCGKTCSTYKAKHPICPRICKFGGCDCKDGYVFDSNVGKCVLPKDCTSTDQCSGQNEFFDTCISGCSNQTCETIGKTFNCPIQPAVCRTGCRCKPGFWRDANNVCVPESECPSTDQCSGQNEFFDTCISGCSNQTCETIGKIFHCPIQPAVCRTGCRCKPGFFRDANNVCVPESECPTPSCPEGEIYSRCPTVKCEGDYCPKTRTSPLTCPVGIVCDPPRCVCGFNSRRDRNTGKCIPTANCPPFKCDGPNEVYKACPAPCPGDNCTDYIHSTKCPPFRIGIVVPCKPQCKCKDGYFRRSDGVCILGCQCGPKETTQPPIVLSSTTTPAPTTDYDDNSPVDVKTALANLQAGVTAFNGKFLYDRIKAEKGQNIIASPFSVLPLLAQLALYASGDCYKQLSSLLNVSSKQAIRAAFPALADSYDGQTSVNFSLADKVYSDKKYPLSAGFKKDSVDVVRADFGEVDFGQAKAAAAAINAWVESKTNNRIKDLIKDTDLNSLTRIVLVNAIYFKGDWLYSFNRNNTKDADFYLSDGTTKKIKLMYQQNQFNYGVVPELNCTVLEMFYKGKNFSMVIVLPDEKDGVIKTAENLQNSDNFNKVLGSLTSQKVKVYIPPFEINTSTDLADILKQEGVTKIFDPKDSGLSGLLETEENTSVSKAIQKAYIKVDETGSEAAAANGIGDAPPRAGHPPPPPIVFRADHAFLYYIRVLETIILCGAFIQ